MARPLLRHRGGFVMRVLILFLACSAADVFAQQATPVRSLLEMRRAHVVVQQWDISCGAAALATVLTYQHGDPVSERAVAEGMLRRTDPLRVKIRGGFSLLDLKRFVESRGYKGIAYMNLTLDDLGKFGPTLVPLKLKGYNHFVVFKGISDGHVLFADPAFGNRRISLADFNDAWNENIGFVVRRADGATAPHNRLVPRSGETPKAPDTVIRAALR